MTNIIARLGILERTAAAFAFAVAACCSACSAPRVASAPAEMPEYPPPAPPRTRAVAPPTDGPADVRSLAGTRWTGTDSDGDHYSFEFRAGGALHYESPAGQDDHGSWTQNGSVVLFETNNHYADWEGTLAGRRLEIKAHNTQGHRWTLTAERER